VRSPSSDAYKRCVETAISRERGDPSRHCRSLIKHFGELTGGQLPRLILDLGCSVGHNAIYLAEAGFKVYGIDIVPEILQEAMKRASNKNAVFVGGCGEFLPFKDSLFDFILLNATLEHVRDWKKVIVEIYRVLKPGGLVYLSTTNRLCPFQQEVKHFPFFSYLPQRMRDKIIDRYPALVDYALFPARHWFSYYALSTSLLSVGFTKTWDIIDVIDVHEIPEGVWKISKPFLPILKVLPHPLRFPIYFAIPGTILYASK